MIKIKNLAVLAGLTGILGATSAHAAAYNGDLFIGFSDGVGNDQLYDLGAPSVMTNGASWNLATLVSTYTLSTVNWGVIGNSSSAGSARLLYTTSDATPATVNAGRGTSINSATLSTYNNFPAAGSGQHFAIVPTDDNSWNRQTLNPTLGTQYFNAWENPNTTGITSFKLWRVKADSSAPVLLGALSLAANGVLTFATNSVASAPPVPQIVAIQRVGSTSTVYFTTTNSFTYSLYYTNSSGLKAPINTWPVVVTTVTGNGLTNSIPDVTSETNRFYRVGVH